MCAGEPRRVRAITAALTPAMTAKKTPKTADFGRRRDVVGVAGGGSESQGGDSQIGRGRHPDAEQFALDQGVHRPHPDAEKLGGDGPASEGGERPGHSHRAWLGASE